MVSEVLRLTADERIALSHQLVEYSRSRGTVFLSVGAESTKQAILYAQEAQRAGADAVKFQKKVIAKEKELIGYIEPMELELK